MTPAEAGPTPAEVANNAGVRHGRLRDAAAKRGIPLGTILVSVAVVALTYLAGKLAYRIRDVLLMIAVAGFVCTRFHLQAWVNRNAPKLQSLGTTLAEPGLRHARPAFLAAAVVAQAASLSSYAQLYRRVLAAFGARIRFRRAADVIMATFFVSHLTPFGSATGALVSASTLETEGIAAATTGEAIALTSLTYMSPPSTS